jgi:hypothetical protein
MSTYLQGFLTIFPEYERKQVEKFLTDNKDVYEIQAVNEEQFEELLTMIQKELKKITALTKQGDTMDAQAFNQFFSAVDVDLKRLYTQHLRTETVVANYDRILKGLLEDMYREVQSLRKRVEELDMKAKGEQGLIVIGYGFEEEKRSEIMETDRGNYSNLFRDRDPMGTELPDVGLVRDYHQHYLMLPVTNKVDCTKDEGGRVTAKINIIERVGLPVVNPIYPIGQAIDTAEETYWSEAIVMDAPITKAKMLKIRPEEG